MQRTVINYMGEKQEISLYHREILPGVWVDVYDLLDCFKTGSPALDHAAKKILAPGKRGYKDRKEDIENSIWSCNCELRLMANREAIRKAHELPPVDSKDDESHES